MPELPTKSLHISISVGILWIGQSKVYRLDHFEVSPKSCHIKIRESGSLPRPCRYVDTSLCINGPVHPLEFGSLSRDVLS